MNDVLFRTGALLGGAAIIATAMAVNPATANDVQKIVHPNGLKACSSSKPCIGGKNSSTGPGVEAENTYYGNGLYAQAANNDGVSSQTTNPSLQQSGRSGVYGFDGSSDGGSGNAGVSGGSTNGFGVLGSSTGHWGIYGVSTNDYGIFGQSTNAISVAASPTGSGNTSQTIQSLGGTSGDSSGFNLATFQNNGTPALWVDNASNAHVNGLIYTHGNCSGGCDRTRGGVISYAAQSSMPTLEDVGTGQLQAGAARIAFDAAFARAINRGAAYAVFVSPEGPNHGLYVTQKTSSGFTVMENPGGHSTIPFSYRIVAKPYGVQAARLPLTMTMPKAHITRAPSRLPH